MPIVQICDADCKTVLKPGLVHTAGWGRMRVYSAEAIADVDVYYAALQAGTADARKVFQKAQEKAAAVFHKKYPDGKLPDEEDDDNGDTSSPNVARSVSTDIASVAGGDAA